MQSVSRTMIMLTVLHPTDEPLPYDLDTVLEEMDTGNAVGQETARTTRELSEIEAREELASLASDPSFFDED